MEKPKPYIKFVDPNDDRKYFIYEHVVGMGYMAIYVKGNVIGKKTMFDKMNPKAKVPLSVLKFGMHQGQTLVEYNSLEELENDLFLENFLEDF